MRWKQLETVPARTPKTDAYMATVEELGDVLILDAWEHRARKFRYCIDVKTGQHGYLTETWSRGKLLTALGTNPNYYWPNDVKYPAIDGNEKRRCLENWDVQRKMYTRRSTGKRLAMTGTNAGILRRTERTAWTRIWHRLQSSRQT